MVSSGQLGVADVVGLTAAEARATLTNEGFRVEEQEGESDKVGVVVRQDPAAGRTSGADLQDYTCVGGWAVVFASGGPMS